MDVAEYQGLGVVDIAHLVLTRALSPVEVLEACFAAIDEAEPLNAWTFVDHRQARERARGIERRITAGESVGALAGVPFGLKDLFCSYPGWPATLGGLVPPGAGSPALTCGFAARMEAADAVAVGLTNSSTLGLSGVTDNAVFGPTRLPWDLHRNAGGSSGGSAAAVVAGSVPYAEGSDAGGSVRIPAAICGAVGFKPTYGTTPKRTGKNSYLQYVGPFANEGPIARSVADTAVVMAHLVGNPALAKALPLDGRCRIGFSASLDVYPVEPDIAEVVSQAAQFLAPEDGELDPVVLGLSLDHEGLTSAWKDMAAISALSAVQNWGGGHGVEPAALIAALPEELADLLNRAATFTIHDVFRLQELRTAVTEVVDRYFETHDLLVCPTVASNDLHNGDGVKGATGPREVAGCPVDPWIGWCLTYLFNFTGHPAASVPCGRDAEGRPIGLQIVGRRNHDLDVLRACATMEQALPWQRLSPVPVTTAKASGGTS
jgi:amidase